MTHLTRIEIKLEKSEFVVRGTPEFVSEMFENYVRIFKQCYGHHPFDEKRPHTNVVHIRDTWKRDEGTPL